MEGKVADMEGNVALGGLLFHIPLPFHTPLPFSLALSRTGETGDFIADSLFENTFYVENTLYLDIMCCSLCLIS